jgi:hypothetical protein
VKYERQEPPNAVQIELVEGCNLRCAVCGLNGIRGKDNDYKYMDSGVLRSAIRQMVELGWNPRIEFAMHGEPSMHPEFWEMIRIVRDESKFPIMMTSNGGGFLSRPGPVDKIRRCFEAGLDTLAFDDYQIAKIVPKIRAAWQQWINDCEKLKIVQPPIKVFDYPQDDDGNPHARSKLKRLVFIEDLINATKGTHSHVNNHAGAGGPPNTVRQTKRCAKPFRELSIRWDGNVSCCCNDWRGTYRAGNVVDDGVDAVWNGKAMGAIRVALYAGRRDMMQACSGCDAISHRVGLLPDKLGKSSLPAPDRSVELDIKKAESRGPLTKPVLRPWEVGT